jgi:hypothetical protein
MHSRDLEPLLNSSTAAIIKELRQIKALLIGAHSLGLVEQDYGRYYVAVPSAEMTNQQVMDLVDPDMKVTYQDDKLRVTDTKGDEGSDGRIWESYWMNIPLTYAQCSEIALCLQANRGKKL